MNEGQRAHLWSLAGWLGTAIGGFAAAISALLVLLTSLHPEAPVRGTSQFPGYLPLLYADSRILPWLFLVMASGAVGAGIGLLRRRRYGRTLALVFCACSITWFLLAVPALWFGVFAPTSDAPSLFFRIGPALTVTPIALAVVAAFVLFFRTLRAHAADFS